MKIKEYLFAEQKSNMNYRETLEYIHNIPKFNRILGNDLLRILLDMMGNPQNDLRFIHIGGTNGKGSTCTMIAEILKQAGYKVGLFTSPYLEYFNERIRINGIPISNDKLVETVAYVKGISEKYDAKVSEFAFDTAVAISYFHQNKCDFVVLEVGLGGKLDATNVIEKSAVTAFTAIGLDHCQYLGDTIDQISQDKFGIIKPNSNVVLYPIQEPVVLKNAENTCKKMNSRLIIPDMPTEYNSDRNSFVYKNKQYVLAMSGEFQIYNAATAIEIANTLIDSGYKIKCSDIYNGLSIAKINGRLDFQDDNLLIDGAHNPQAVSALLNALKSQKRPIYFLTAVMQDKDYSEIVKLISDFAAQNNSKVAVTEIDMPRCLPCRELSNEFAKHNITASSYNKSQDAIKALMAENNQNALICVCGSLYLAGEVKRGL